MRIKENTDVVSFLNTVKKCKGEVSFSTPEGDCLNLKSLLSQYILVSVLENETLHANGQIKCTEDDDYDALSPYLEI